MLLFQLILLLMLFLARSVVPLYEMVLEFENPDPPTIHLGYYSKVVVKLIQVIHLSNPLLRVPRLGVFQKLVLDRRWCGRKPIGIVLYPL